MATLVYVDGFNFYYRVVKGTRYKWLDFSTLCRLLLPGHDVGKIKYFTAHVSARPNDPGGPQRQQTYLRALRTIGNLDIILGQFVQHKVPMPIADSVPIRFVTVVRTDEKGSDVNLASHMLNDGHKGLYDVCVVISDDSDLTEPLRMVKQELRLTTGILTSKDRPSLSLNRYADFYKQIREGVLRVSQFPDQLKDAKGIFHKPASW